MAKLTLTDLSSLTNQTTAINQLNNNFTAIEQAIEKTLSRDGTSPNTMTASLDMNNQRILNLPQPVNPSEPARYGDLTGVLEGAEQARDEAIEARDQIQDLIDNFDPIEGGSAFSTVSDGTSTATATGLDTLKFISSDGTISITVGSDHVTHGDHVDLEVDTTELASVLDHDSLSGFVADEHIDHSTVSIIAGTGLSGGGDLTESRTIQLDASLGNLSDVDIDSVTSGDVLQYDGSDWVNVPGSSFAGSSHTHSASAITSGTFDDARIKASNVTQHAGAISITSLSGYDANKYVDHSAVSIATGSNSGLSGGGNLTATRNLSVNINGLLDRDGFGSGDKLMIYDASAGGLRKIDYDDLPSGGGGSGGLNDAFKYITDGTNTVTASGGDTFKIISSDASVSITVDDAGGTDKHVDITVPNSGGDVSGPASSTNDNIAVFDGTSGKLIKDSGANLSQYIPSYQKGANGGVCPLDNGGKIEFSYLPTLVTSVNSQTGSVSITASSLGAVPDTRQVTGQGLATGGGDLTGDVEIEVTEASTSEAQAGTSGTVVMTPRRTDDAIRYRVPVVWQIALSDLSTNLTTGTNMAYFRAPHDMTITAVRSSLLTASNSGLVTVDINKNGTTILSTKLSIDANEKTSVTAATAAVISDTSIADDDELTFDIDAAGTNAKGLVVTIIGRR